MRRSSPMTEAPPIRSQADELAHSLGVILSLYETAKAANDAGWQSDKDADVRNAREALKAWAEGKR